MNGPIMNIFKVKDGRTIVARVHIASFSGRHNMCKSKTLIALYKHKFEMQQSSGLSLRELARSSGVSYMFLKSRLGIWTRWKYIIRKVRDDGNRPVYCYTISERGINFYENVIPPDKREQYIAEIKESRQAINKKGNISTSRHIITKEDILRRLNKI